MKNLFLFVIFTACLAACQRSETGPWADFKKCATNNCVKEAIAVKDAFLKNPQKLLAEFQKTYEDGDDHVVGWLQILQDSVLLNSKTGTVEQRFAMQQAILGAAKPFESDPKVGESAKTIVGTIELLAIASELEDDIVEPSSDPISGTYTFDKGDNGGGELQVSLTASDKIKFKLSVSGSAPAHNQGMLEGEATLSPGNEATFSMNEYGGECSLQFAWVKDAVVIKTLKGEPATCGFGNNVRADETYRRKNYDDPFLSKANAKAAALLLGEWQSADDPKASIKIADGQYMDMYEGQEPMPAMRYIYYAVCPKDCNPATNMPCLKIIGQDDVCYSIVKADGKTLEISQIGGTGNTNRYKKKK